MRRFIAGVLLLTYISVCVTADNNEKVGESLFLTPFIENGNIEAAKQKAAVEHPEMKGVTSYAGYVTINKQYNSNTFFWFFPSQNDPKNDPLLIWMNGGPGSSSLLALFMENGPFAVTKNQTLEARKYSWHRNHNIIFIDNPIGAGYSFTENDLGYANTQDDVGRDVLTFLLQFFEMFPEYKDNEFFVTGESYAGMYVPAVSHAIKMHNAKAETKKINMKGLAIGNGITDPINQMNRSDFIYNIGIFDSHDRDKMRAEEDKIRFLIRKKEYVKAILVYDQLFSLHFTSGPSLFTKLSGFNYYYNFLQTKQPEEIDRFIEWVQKSESRKALHVGNSEFKHLNKVVKKHLKGVLIQSVAHYVADLLETHKVMIYNGQLDICVPYTTTEEYIRKMNWTGAKDYPTTERKQWKVDNDIAGYSTSVGNLDFVLVRNAGHFVPTDQPLWAYDMITRFTHGKEFTD